MPDRLVAWGRISNGHWPTLLVGNGLSINVWRNFSYARLLEQADLNAPARQLFADLGTTNFEVVLEALWHAERTLTALGRPTAQVSALYTSVQQQLVKAVRRVHVPWESLMAPTLTHIAAALRAHRMVFTLNYDLLTYWAVLGGGEGSAFGDYFWSNHNMFNIADCDLSATRTGLLYLHGGVHLWQDAVTGYTGKWTRRSGGRLLSNLEQNFDEIPSRRPLFVSEGTSPQKMAVIRRSDYLSFARRCLIDDLGDTVIFGASFGSQDAHVIEALNAGPRRTFAISIWSTTEAQDIATMARYRQGLPMHDLHFFDSRTHPLGDQGLAV